MSPDKRLLIKGENWASDSDLMAFLYRYCSRKSEVKGKPLKVLKY